MLQWSYICRFIGCLCDASLWVFENIVHLFDLNQKVIVALWGMYVGKKGKRDQGEGEREMREEEKKGGEGEEGRVM